MASSPQNKKMILFVVINLMMMFFVWVSSLFNVSIFSYFAIGFSWPFLSACNLVDQQLKNFWQGYAADREQIRVLEVERNHLTLQVSYLMEEVQRLQKANSRSQSTIALPSRWRCLPTSLVIKDEWFCSLHFFINVGLDHGVQVGNVVMEDGVVIGKIDVCQKNISRVVILHDNRCRLSVRVKGTNLLGIIGGVDKSGSKDRNNLILRYLPYSEVYKEGMEIVTSGLSPVVPPELPIGKMVNGIDNQIVTTSDRLYYCGLVRPFFDRCIQQNLFVVIKNK